MAIIEFDQFAAVEVRVGTVVNASVFKEARKPAYILHVDFGEEIGVKKSSAQITDLYDPDTLIGKQVVCSAVNVNSRTLFTPASESPLVVNVSIGPVSDSLSLILPPIL